jgi:integrase
MRPVEVCTLKVKDIDLQQKLAYPTTAKHGNPRVLKISQTLATTLQAHITKNNLQPNHKLFTDTPQQYGKAFRNLRNRIANKLNDPTIKTIRLYDFRHYFCTKKLYDKINPYEVMTLMGHKRLETTQIYMHLITLDQDPEYDVIASTTIEQDKELLSKGFELKSERDGTKLFIKRK